MDACSVEGGKEEGQAGRCLLSCLQHFLDPSPAQMDASRPHGIIAKITDFGMSTTIDPTLSHISGFNKGTPCYAAPEVMLSHQATKTTDVSQRREDEGKRTRRNEGGG